MVAVYACLRFGPAHVVSPLDDSVQTTAGPPLERHKITPALVVDHRVRFNAAHFHQHESSPYFSPSLSRIKTYQHIGHHVLAGDTSSVQQFDATEEAVNISVVVPSCV